MKFVQARNRGRSSLLAFGLTLAAALPSFADSVNSPNITLNVDTNRAAATGNGAGNVSLVVNTITIAETMLPEYSAGGTNRITIAARTGFQFDPTSNVTAQSATFGINGGGLNAVATVVPTGAANEVLTFNLTSAAANSTSVQDIIRVSGIRVRILNAAGAVGPAQTTFALTTSTAGGAFTNQGIVAANITRGAADRLVFATQPGDTQAGEDILPAVQMVDFGGNVVNNDSRTITLALQDNPGAATLQGTNASITNQGVATWADADNLNITTAASGYTLRASHSGANFLTSDTVDSAPFSILAGPAGSLEISTQPQDTVAGEPILVTVTARDEFGNPASSPVDVTLDAAVNPQGWPLLVDSTLTKTTTNGVASWSAADNLRVNRAVADYRLTASGLGTPLFTAPFDILAGDASALRFVQQPTDTDQSDAVNPTVSVEIIDEFGNRTASTASVQLALNGAACGGSTTGNVAAAVAGLAEFPALRFNTPCDDVSLTASATGLVGTTSDTFDVGVGPQIATSMQFSLQPADTTAGAPVLVSVLVVDQFGRPFVEASVGITLSLSANPTGADLLVDSTLTKQTVNGVASWVAGDNLRIEEAAANYALTATGVGTPVASAAFDILGGAPATVQFVQQPTDVTEGESIAPAVTVQARDAFDNPAANGTAVSLQLIDNCGAQLSGGAAVTTNGVATFTNLVIDEACEDVTLRAVVSGVNPVTSNVFDVLAANDGPPACGACGAGAPLAFAPLLLMMLPRGRRWLRGGR